MNNEHQKGTFVEGLTWKSLQKLLELEFNYAKMIDELDKKKEELKEKYKSGTVEFEWWSADRFGPQYRKMIYVKDDALKLLQESLDASKRRIEELDEKVKYLEDRLKRSKELQKAMSAI
jgi:chromosome segregation ATPase